jgi:hypothetical protein
MTDSPSPSPWTPLEDSPLPSPDKLTALRESHAALTIELLEWLREKNADPILATMTLSVTTGMILGGVTKNPLLLETGLRLCDRTTRDTALKSFAENTKS